MEQISASKLGRAHGVRQCISCFLEYMYSRFTMVGPSCTRPYGLSHTHPLFISHLIRSDEFSKCWQNVVNSFDTILSALICVGALMHICRVTCYRNATLKLSAIFFSKDELDDNIVSVFTACRRRCVLRPKFYVQAYTASTKSIK